MENREHTIESLQIKLFWLLDAIKPLEAYEVIGTEYGAIELLF